jgi:recombination protein RecT
MSDQSANPSANQALVPFRTALTQAQGAFGEALPAIVAKTLTPERLTRITLSALGRNDKLLRCTPTSVLRAVMDAASLGLEPTGGALGQAYLVPYGNEAQLIIGYRGFIALAQRTGCVLAVEARPVYEADYFVVEYGDSPKTTHRPSFDADPGELIAAYAIATLAGGVRLVEAMSRAQIDKIRARSRSRNNGPWVTDYDEMARKTVVRRAAKYWPMSLDLSRALEIDNRDYEDARVYDAPRAELAEGAHTVRRGRPGSHSGPSQPVSEPEPPPDPTPTPERDERPTQGDISPQCREVLDMIAAVETVDEIAAATEYAAEADLSRDERRIVGAALRDRDAKVTQK